MERKVLGKGLDALIPKNLQLTQAKEFTYLKISQLKEGKFQPRKEINQKEIEELASSIKEKGFIQPIVVRKIDQDYEIVAGGRRYLAAKLLGLKEVPVIIKDLDDKDALVFAIVENLQRKDLNPLEEAQAFKRLIDEFKFTLDDLSKFISKDKTTISNTLRLLQLPQEIKDALKNGIISRSHARTLLAVEDPSTQYQLFYQILNSGLSVREIEKRVKIVSKKKKQFNPFVQEIEEKLQKIFGTKVRIFNKKNNKGRIIIEYYNLNDLERIVRRLT
ncbi:MAG: ParB/RepB/Spo0J family partition protein [Candidatus Omnitrophica bacterium]|nr:ParB/RepB/Spo0J family partition protein [Candidatus Omnitrophota bacterium]